MSESKNKLQDIISEEWFLSLPAEDQRVLMLIILYGMKNEPIKIMKHKESGTIIFNPEPFSDPESVLRRDLGITISHANRTLRRALAVGMPESVLAKPKNAPKRCDKDFAAEVLRTWREVLPELPAVLLKPFLNGKRYTHLSARYFEHPEHQKIEFWRWLFQSIRHNPHRMGANGWRATLGWVLEQRNFEKVLEDAVAMDNERKQKIASRSHLSVVPINPNIV